MVGKLLTSFIQWHSLVRTSWSRRVENKHIKELLRFWQKVNRTWVQWDIKHLLSKCLKIAVGTWFKSLGPSSLLPKPTLPDTKQNSEKKKVYFPTQQGLPQGTDKGTNAIGPAGPCHMYAFCKGDVSPKDEWLLAETTAGRTTSLHWQRSAENAEQANQEHARPAGAWHL